MVIDVLMDLREDLERIVRRLERTSEYLRAATEQSRTSELGQQRRVEAASSATAETRAIKASLEETVAKLAALTKRAA